MNYVFESIWIFWIVSEILLNRLFRSKAKKSKEMDRNSLRIIWLTIIGSVALGVYIARFVNYPIIYTNLLRYAGTTLIILGILIRFIAIKTLGKFFTVDLTVRDDHKLINTGLYRLIRHPSYTGSLLSFFGFGLSLNIWICMFVVFVPVLISFLYGINLEEKLLLERFGGTYAAYMKKTKRLIPHIY